MATIYPFKALLPSEEADVKIVLMDPQTESLALSGADGKTFVLKAVLEAITREELDNGSRWPHDNNLVNQTIKEFIHDGLITQSDHPCFYVYEITQLAEKQTGIWCLTDLDDYTSGNVKTHELTLENTVKRLKNYRQETGFEGNPVLLMYPPEKVINQLIEQTKYGEAISLGNQHGIHRLWKIQDQSIESAIIDAFSNISHVYLADGHHRFSSAALLAKEKHGRSSPYENYLSTLYMATDQIRVAPFHRIVLPAEPIQEQEFLNMLSQYFYWQKSSNNQIVMPDGKNLIGMLMSRRWYCLRVKLTVAVSGSPSEMLDTVILQEKILSNFFGISDPRTDPRLRCIGGVGAVEELIHFCSQHPEAIAFTLSPIGIENIMEVADASEILPPKSTWINPKVPYGFLMYKR